MCQCVRLFESECVSVCDCIRMCDCICVNVCECVRLHKCVGVSGQGRRRGSEPRIFLFLSFIYSYSTAKL